MHTVALEGSPESVKEARDFVRSRLELRTFAVQEKVVLLVSELATNAVVHVGDRFTAWVEVLAGCVRAGIDDPSGILPTAGSLDDHAPGGRGLAMVATVADRWGADRTPTGKRVWFEIYT